MTPKLPVPLPIGARTPFGKIVGIMWRGERFYICQKGKKEPFVISLVPGDMIHSMKGMEKP